MKSLAITILFSITSFGMNLNTQATCGVLFSVVSASNRQQDNQEKSEIWHQKMLSMINKMRTNGYDDDTINKAIASNMLKAVEIIKSSQQNPAKYKKFVNQCLDELEK